MANMTEQKRNEILDVYVAAVCKHAKGEMSDEKMNAIKQNVVNQLFA